MAVLSDGERQGLWAAWMRENRSPVGSLTKAQLRAAVDAIDNWVEDNATSFNQAIPQPARSVLTAKQKIDLFLYVVRRRFEVG